MPAGLPKLRNAPHEKNVEPDENHSVGLTAFFQSVSLKGALEMEDGFLKTALKLSLERAMNRPFEEKPLPARQPRITAALPAIGRIAVSSVKNIGKNIVLPCLSPTANGQPHFLARWLPYHASRFYLAFRNSRTFVRKTL